MTSNTWYTVARTADSECIGRVTFSIDSSTLVFDVLIQFGNISLAIVSATVQQSVGFHIRLRSSGGFIYVDLKSDTAIDATPSFSVSKSLNNLDAIPWAEAGQGAQVCLISTDAVTPEPGQAYVTIDGVEVITAKKYFSQGLAFGDQSSSRTMALGNGGVYLDGQKIVTADVLNSYITTGSYNSNSKKIELKHGSTVVAQIDATAFIKDGMVDTVSVTDGYLVITFNTDSGKEDISIPITSFFDASNYYTKTQADNRYLTSVPVAGADVLGGIKVGSNLSIDENGVLSATGGGGGGGGSTAWGDITSKPSTLSGYGITDAKISSGTITLGSDTITPLTSFTETDPTVPSWAKASSKPSYNFSEIGSKPTTLSGYGITDAKISSGTITLGSDTITPLTSFTETDPTVPSWAKADSKPTYTASEVGALPDDTAIPANTSDLNNDSGFITSSDIPSDVSAFNNDAGYLTSYTETDPTVPSWAKASSKPSYTFSEIGSKPTTISGYGITDAKISSGTITLGSDSITPLTSFTETDPTVPSWAKQSSKPSYAFSEIGSTPTTLSGYGITDAKIEGGTITLGSNTITPVTSQDLSLDTSGESKKSFFSRTLPSGMTGNKGMIMSIYGKSVVLNQLAQNGDFSDSTNGWSRKSTSDSWSVSGGEITITKGQMTAGAVFYSTSVGTVNTSHKYYIAASMKSNTSGQSMMMGFMTAAGAFSGNTSLDTTSTSYVRLSGIVQPKNSSDRFSLREGGASSPTGISGSAKNVVCINLTKMFGSGNEPTLADFEAMFPLDYYAYNTGQFLSLAATGVQTGSSTLTLPLTTAASGGNAVFPNGLMSVNGVADEMTSTIAIVRVGSRTYTSGDENDITLLTDKTTTIYALATPQVYVLDSKADLVFDYTAGTTQAVLPAHSSSPSSTPLTCDVMYGSRLALAFGELNNKIDKMITM